MTPDKIKQRTVYKKSSKLEDRASFSNFSRRETNVSIKKDEHPNDGFEDFFEFEENLGDLIPASQQYAEQEKVTQEEDDANLSNNTKEDFIIMERNDD
jgi:hypothetical protein